MKLLDLYCGAGGAAMGYHRAGFRIVGVDTEPQPNYPFVFLRADALDVLSRTELVRKAFDAIHASPPCQAFTAYQRTGRVGAHPDLIAQTRRRLEATGLPYVIENVEGAPLHDPVRLCGSSFGLDIRRHRLFETNWPLLAAPCAHGIHAPDRYPGGRSRQRTGTSTGLVRATIEIGAWDIAPATQQAAMEIDWMTPHELSQAIPPAYTELIGHQLAQHIARSAA